MKVAIVTYSGTGNTRGVAELLATKIRARGGQAEIREITVTGNPNEGLHNFELATIPSMDDADALVLASPVQAFSLSSVMKAYLSRSNPPQRPVRVLITQHFPRPWMGGRQALSWIRRWLKRGGGSVGESMIVNWSGKARQRQIEEGTDRLSAWD